jgi:hypothetical protein
MFKRIGFILIFILALIIPSYSQVITISFGPAVTVLSTASTGAVTGGTFALPGGNAAVLTVTVVADGSALSTNFQASTDNSNWFTISSCTTAAGCLYNSGVIAFPFVRVSQVSRTGGTITTASITAFRAYPVLSGGSGLSTTITGNLLFSPDNTWDIGTPGALRPRALYVGANIDAGTSIQTSAISILGWSGRSRMFSDVNGNIRLSNNANNDFTLLQFGGTSASFPALKRSTTVLQAKLADDSAFAQVGLQSLAVNATLFANLGTPANGTWLYCSDCLANSNPCTGASTGAFAKRLNGAWDCR